MPKQVSQTTINRDGVPFTSTYLDFSQEIQKGARFLDVVKPGWESQIDPKLLDVADYTACVCGQVFAGHYWEGTQALAEWLNNLDEEGESEVDGDTVAWEFGFNLPCDSGDTANERAAAAESREWAAAYVDSHEGDEEYDNLLFSTLTEQWISEINFRLGKSPIALNS